MSQNPPTAALLIIGNEILSGKVRDENMSFLAQELFAMGWQFREVAVVGDVVSEIISTLKRFHDSYDHVFTSGGVGPTHDDKTVEAIAEALGRKLVASPLLEKLLKKHYKTDVLTPSQMRLATICEGSVLHYGPDSLYPQAVVDRVYPLPGIPGLFRKKFRELKDLWPEVSPPSRRCFKMVAMETDLAALLGALAEDHPKVSLGSYPSEIEGVWHLELVLESRDAQALEQANKSLRKILRAKNIEWQEPETSESETESSALS